MTKQEIYQKLAEGFSTVEDTLRKIERVDFMAKKIINGRLPRIVSIYRFR